MSSGPEETRARRVPRGVCAPEAAARIHSDFARGFIRAECVSSGDFIRLGGKQGAREGGVMRSEGRDYRIRDGDVVHFRFNV